MSRDEQSGRRSDVWSRLHRVPDRHKTGIYGIDIDHAEICPRCGQSILLAEITGIAFDQPKQSDFTHKLARAAGINSYTIWLDELVLRNVLPPVVTSANAAEAERRLRALTAGVVQIGNNNTGEAIVCTVSALYDWLSRKHRDHDRICRR